MSHLGFVRVATATPEVRVADCAFNLQNVMALFSDAEAAHAAVVCFPELCLCGCTCGDLFRHSTLLRAAEAALNALIAHSAGKKTVAVVGLPVEIGHQLFNCAAVVFNGTLCGLVPKSILSAEELRWFAAPEQMMDCEKDFAGQRGVKVCTHLLFRAPHFTLGIAFGSNLSTPLSSDACLALAGADVICCPGAALHTMGINDALLATLQMQSKRCKAGYVLSMAGLGESTAEGVYAGLAAICEDGKVITSSQYASQALLQTAEIDTHRLRHFRRMDTAFAARRNTIYNVAELGEVWAFDPMADKLSTAVCATPFAPDANLLPKHCDEAFRIQTHGLAHRMAHIHAKRMVIGISGGLDSTLALLVCCAVADQLGLPRTSILAITMPGFGTSKRTRTNAHKLMRTLGVEMREISIKKACLQHFADIQHNRDVHDVTYENSQARERTQILMDVANQVDGLVVGTGDLSELALGWATFNGDHMSNYGVNASIPKTFMQQMVRHLATTEKFAAVAKLLQDVVDTPISPELTPTDEGGNIAQKTENLVGPYELHDFFLYHLMVHGFSPRKIYFLACHAFAQYEPATIQHWLKTFTRRFFQQQFKRSCMPEGPIVTCCSLSPRGAWTMPSDAFATIWLKEIEGLEKDAEAGRT